MCSTLVPVYHFGLIVAERYWIQVGECPDAVCKTREDVLMLVFLLGGGTNKEVLEPTIHRLFQNQQTAALQKVQFQDMWSLNLLNERISRGREISTTAIRNNTQSSCADNELRCSTDNREVIYEITEY